MYNTFSVTFLWTWKCYGCSTFLLRLVIILQCFRKIAPQGFLELKLGYDGGPHLEKFCSKTFLLYNWVKSLLIRSYCWGAGNQYFTSQSRPNTHLNRLSQLGPTGALFQLLHIHYAGDSYNFFSAIIFTVRNISPIWHYKILYNPHSLGNFIINLSNVNRSSQKKKAKGQNNILFSKLQTNLICFTIVKSALNRCCLLYFFATF